MVRQLQGIVRGRARRQQHAAEAGHGDRHAWHRNGLVAHAGCAAVVVDHRRFHEHVRRLEPVELLAEHVERIASGEEDRGAGDAGAVAGDLGRGRLRTQRRCETACRERQTEQNPRERSRRLEHGRSLRSPLPPARGAAAAESAATAREAARAAAGGPRRRARAVPAGARAPPRAARGRDLREETRVLALQDREHDEESDDDDRRRAAAHGAPEREQHAHERRGGRLCP